MYHWGNSLDLHALLILHSSQSKLWSAWSAENVKESVKMTMRMRLDRQIFCFSTFILGSLSFQITSLTVRRHAEQVFSSSGVCGKHWNMMIRHKECMLMKLFLDYSFSNMFTLSFTPSMKIPLLAGTPVSLMQTPVPLQRLSSWKKSFSSKRVRWM